jgi:uncharacterized membrane protein
MAFCAKCGTALAEGATFCGSCGAPSETAAPGAPASAASVSAPGAMAANVAGLLTYVLGFISGIIFLVLEPYNRDKFVRFHAFQSIFFNVAIIVFWIAYTIVSTVLGIVSFGVLGIVMAILGLLIFLGILVYWVFLMYKAYNNEKYVIPYIGKLAAQQAG